MRLIATLLSTFYFILSTSALALASDSALSASPAILETILYPSKPTQTTVTIQNNTNFPLPVKGSASSFLSTETIPEASKDTYNASRWFKLDPSDFILQPNEVKKVTVTITPPNNAEPGGHYATLYFRPLIPQDALSAGSTISLARIGVLSMMIMPGDINEKLEIGPLHAPTWLGFGPVPYTTTLHNTGNVHLIPTSTLVVKNLWGKILHEARLEPTLILPKTTKERRFTWDTKLGLGPYIATLTTTYGTDQAVQTSNHATTWLIPWPLLLSTIVFLTFTYKIFIVNRRRLVLALRVLKGQYEPLQTTQEDSLNHPGSRRRPHSTLSPQPGIRHPRR